MHAPANSPSPPSAPAPDGAAAGVGPDVLDREALDKLRELDPSGAGGLVQRVLATYTTSLARLLGDLASARAKGDAGGLRHVAHTLKSSSASVGALQLSALCADIERNLREGPGTGLEPQLDAMAREGERVLAALRSSNPR